MIQWYNTVWQKEVIRNLSYGAICVESQTHAVHSDTISLELSELCHMPHNHSAIAAAGWLWSRNKNDWCANESFSRLRSTGWTLKCLSEGSAGATRFPFRGAEGPPGLLLASPRVFFLWADRSEGATGWLVILAAQRRGWLYSWALSLTDVSDWRQIVYNRALCITDGTPHRLSGDFLQSTGVCGERRYTAAESAEDVQERCSIFHNFKASARVLVSLVSVFFVFFPWEFLYNSIIQPTVHWHNVSFISQQWISCRFITIFWLDALLL